LGDLRRQPRCYGSHAVAGKLQGAEEKEAEVLITKKEVLFDPVRLTLYMLNLKGH
jgi:hypothetical protein